MVIEAIVTKNIELTPELEVYLRAKIQKIMKIVVNMKPASICVEIGKPATLHKKEGIVFYTELRLTLRQQEFFSRKRAATVFNAIESARHDLHRQIISWKKKQQTIKRKNGTAMKQFLRSEYGDK
ncbi:MAG: HPF/RaiA family ribosome-associated protein [bacterium]|nr:HPF/RaiA family ribosome-associated protein [bacterium]